MKKLEPALTLDDRDKLKRLAAVIPVVQYALTYIEHLEAQVCSYQRTAEAISQALNEGNGTYKP